MVRDGRSPRGRDEGPSSALGLGPVAGLGGVAPREFRHNSPLAQGRCPVCNLKMNNGNQRACIKLPRDNSWQAMRKRGRGGYVYGRGKAA